MNNYEKHMKQLLENIEYIKNILKNTKTKWKNMENKWKLQTTTINTGQTTINKYNKKTWQTMEKYGT